MGTPFSLIELFLSAAKALGSISQWKLARRESGMQQVADYFEQVAGCLREVAERIEAGDAPRDTCRRLAVYAGELELILADRRYVTPAGDASLDETRLRLVGELGKARGMWAASSIADPAELTSEDLASVVTLASTLPKPEPAESTVERAQAEIAARAEDGHVGAQPIWDAAGEFKALADALRAR